MLTDVDMLLMFEDGTRAGISQGTHKYATANIKYMKKFNKEIISTFLLYLDANNLYGWAICEKRPIGGFKLIDPKEYTEEKIKSYDDNSNTGAILKVDIEYLKELHKLHKDLPFLCERRRLNKASKLVTTLDDKKEYVVHISTLKQTLNHDLILKQVHNILEFKQRAWMNHILIKIQN